MDEPGSQPTAPGDPLPEAARRGVSRRAFLGGALAGAAGVALGPGAAEAARRRRVPATARRRRHGPAHDEVDDTRLPSGVTVPTARWLVEENRRPGTLDWVVTGIQAPHVLEGYASHVSARAGDEVAVHVNTTARAVQVQAYRMGYYQGLGGRLVDQTDAVAGRPQPPPTFAPGVNTVSCEWEPTLTFRVGEHWPPGDYLLKLVGDGGQQQYVPLTVRDDRSRAAFVLQNSVTTWQAYNLWGSYDLYYGTTPGGGSDFANRSRIVSFDRPYPKVWAQGAADFFGNEFPLLYQMERLGLDLTYWTDVDLHERPHLLARHRCLFSLGHDEYWSLTMRNAAIAALRAGTNLAFLGANACYRQVRFQPSPVGSNRQQICYKDAAADPMYGVDDQVVTGPAWVSPPTSWPESLLIGSMYQSVGADDDLVVTDGGSWLFDGCGLADGQVLPKVVQGEYDRYVPSLPGPRNVDVLGHSPVAGQGNWSDITYYTAGGGGGVLATGTASFVYKLSDTTAFPWNIVPKAVPGVTDVLLRAMENVYATFGHGPASKVQPSSGTASDVYGGLAGLVPSAAGSTAA